MDKLQLKERARDYSESVVPTNVYYGESDADFQRHQDLEAGFIAGYSQFREDIIGFLEQSVNKYTKRADSLDSSNPDEIFCYGKAEGFRDAIRKINSPLPERDSIGEYACKYSSRISKALAERFDRLNKKIK